MKNKFFIILGILMLLVPNLSLGQTLGEEPPDELASFSINQLKYDPYPAEPGEYMTLWLEVYNMGTDKAENVIFELKPEYPFSLDASENAIREFSEIPGLYTLVLQYKIRVDKDAVEGLNKIKIRYKIGDNAWIEKENEISVEKPPEKAELKAFFVGTEPKAYPGGETKLSVDLANLASGSAYYIYVGAESDVAEIEVNEIFIGTMDADDFDTIDFDLKIKDGTEPGKYPVAIKSYYKDEDGKKYEKEDTVYVTVYTQEEALKGLEEKTPWYVYVAYLIVALVAIKYLIWPVANKAYSFLRRKKK